MAYGQTARFAPEAPRYRLIAPFFGPDDCLYAEDTELEWDGVPNEHMEPLNQAAEDRIRAYLESLPPPAGVLGVNGGTPELADIVEAAMRNRPRYAEDRQVALPEGPKERVMAALGRNEAPDPADLAALAAAAAPAKEITIPRKDPTVPLQGTVTPPEGTPMRRRGRPPGSGKIKVTGAPGRKKNVVKLMGNIRDVGPEAQFVGPEPITQSTQLTPGSTISQG